MSTKKVFRDNVSCYSVRKIHLSNKHAINDHILKLSFFMFYKKVKLGLLRAFSELIVIYLAAALAFGCIQLYSTYRYIFVFLNFVLQYPRWCVQITDEEEGVIDNV